MSAAWALALWLGCAGAPTAQALAPGTPVALSTAVADARRALAQAGVTALRWGYTPYLGVDGEIEGWRPVFAWLGDALGIPNLIGGTRPGGAAR